MTDKMNEKSINDQKGYLNKNEFQKFEIDIEPNNSNFETGIPEETVLKIPGTYSFEKKLNSNSYLP